MGRKKLEGYDGKKVERADVPLSKEEYQEIESKAKKNHLSIAGYIRAKVFDII